MGMQDDGEEDVKEKDAREHVLMRIVRERGALLIPTGNGGTRFVIRKKAKPRGETASESESSDEKC